MSQNTSRKNLQTSGSRMAPHTRETNMSCCAGNQPPFAQDRTAIWDWSSTDIRVDSQGSRRNKKSIHHRVIEELKKQPFNVILDDDHGDSADVIGITEQTNNADLVGMLKEYATDFTPPQVGLNGATGLYCGWQDLFCFLIDPSGWAEIDGGAFAPGFFVWNSEVGKRSVGIQTFWFQKVWANHIVWDAVEVIDFTRKQTARVGDALGEIRRHVEALVAKRDERRDGFARVTKKAMRERLGTDAEEVMKALVKNGLQ